MNCVRGGDIYTVSVEVTSARVRLTVAPAGALFGTNVSFPVAGAGWGRLAPPAIDRRPSGASLERGPDFRRLSLVLRAHDHLIAPTERIWMMSSPMIPASTSPIFCLTPQPPRTPRRQTQGELPFVSI